LDESEEPENQRTQEPIDVKVFEEPENQETKEPMDLKVFEESNSDVFYGSTVLQFL
jgi:hypothetical protein